MKKSYLLILGLTVFWLFPRAAAAAPDKAVPRQVAQVFADAGLPVLRQRVAVTDFSVPLLDGKSRTLQDLSGKVIFLNFWATWCGPCRQEMPSMEALYRRFKAQGLEILAVDYMEDPTLVSGFMDEYKLSFPTALDSSGRIAASYGITAFPTTYIIDREGFIISRIIGSLNWNTPKIFAAFDTLLKAGSL
ncbi:MAG: TlpA family protein disulfide reductase [Spirochaetaceae bacterium]|jgi:thiol-disulfide isomerase/thioredoxin|nr:TlpA family protein disulfide reductase [Spirochaetaceae bacterium]